MSGHEENSIKEAGGCAAGFTGRFFNFNADAEARLAEALFTVGKFVQGESGCLLGHIKAAVVNKDGVGITLNLIDMDNGVEHHGTMPRCDEAEFNFMCAVLDVDEYELTHKMLHAIDDSGIDYFINKESLEHHHHHHDHEHGECDDPNCECHKHEHGECDDPECSCHHHHHHGEGECDDPECECHKHDLASMIDENGHFHHHHHHDHEHGECHCHDHDHEHHHHHEEGGCCCGHHHDDDEHECDCHDHDHEHGECHCHDHDHEHHHHHEEGGCCCGHHHDDDEHECDCHDHDHEHEHGECHCHDEKPAAEEKKKKGLFGFLKRK